MSSSRSDRLYITDILDSIEAIQSYTQFITLEQFTQDRKTYSAAIREFEIIGEAISKLSKETLNQISPEPILTFSGSQPYL